jgi:glycosyltransferase involved in cell wall biosynthesis
VDEKQRLRTALGVPGGIIICFVGIIIARKNVDMILRVWKQVVDQGVRGHLLLVGPIPKDEHGVETQYCHELRQYVIDHGLSKNVTFTGYQEVVSDYLRASDIFFFPSKQEGMPNVLLEAMACGLPCVVSRISGTEDLVQDCENGIILPLDHEDKFVSAILRLIQEPALATQVGETARTFVNSGYSLRITAEKYRLLYHRILDGTR